jgi:hypothetical protein
VATPDIWTPETGALQETEALGYQTEVINPRGDRTVPQEAMAVAATQVAVLLFQAEEYPAVPAEEDHPVAAPGLDINTRSRSEVVLSACRLPKIVTT